MTNSVPNFSDQIPVLNLFPESWRGWIVILVWAAPYATRFIHSMSNGSGVWGAIKAFLFGTNTDPKLTENVKKVLDAVQNGQQVVISRDSPTTT